MSLEPEDRLAVSAALALAGLRVTCEQVERMPLETAEQILSRALQAEACTSLHHRALRRVARELRGAGAEVTAVTRPAPADDSGQDGGPSVGVAAERAWTLRDSLLKEVDRLEQGLHDSVAGAIQRLPSDTPWVIDLARFLAGVNRIDVARFDWALFGRRLTTYAEGVLGLGHSLSAALKPLAAREFTNATNRAAGDLLNEVTAANRRSRHRVIALQQAALQLLLRRHGDDLRRVMDCEGELLQAIGLRFVTPTTDDAELFEHMRAAPGTVLRSAPAVIGDERRVLRRGRVVEVEAVDAPPIQAGARPEFASASPAGVPEVLSEIGLEDVLTVDADSDGDAVFDLLPLEMTPPPPASVDVGAASSGVGVELSEVVPTIADGTEVAIPACIDGAEARGADQQGAGQTSPRGVEGEGTGGLNSALA